MTTEQVYSLGAGTQIIGVRFRPGMARAVLGAPPGEFTDSFVQLEDFWPRRGKELEAHITELEPAARRMQALRHAIKPYDGTVNPVQRAIQAMYFAHGNV